jgi:hypothetical protein
LATAHNLGTELSTTHFDQLLSMWWKPQYQTWFLYDLIVYNVVYLAVRAVDRRLVLAVAVALFAASSWFGDVEMSSLVGKGIRHFGRLFLFYWLVIVLARWVLARRVEQERLLLVSCLAAFLLLAVPPVLLGHRALAHNGNCVGVAGVAADAVVGPAAGGDAALRPSGLGRPCFPADIVPARHPRLGARGRRAKAWHRRSDAGCSAVRHRGDGFLLWHRPPDAKYGCVPSPGFCSTDPTHGGSAGEDAGSGSASLALERCARHLGQGSAHCARCRQIAARWQAGEPGASNNRQTRRGAAASDAEAAQQLQFVAQQLSIGVLLFRLQGSPLEAKGLSTRHG